MIFGLWVAASFHTVAELRIADLLAREPPSADELATAAGVRPDPCGAGHAGLLVGRAAISGRPQKLLANTITSGCVHHHLVGR